MGLSPACAAFFSMKIEMWALGFVFLFAFEVCKFTYTVYTLKLRYNLFFVHGARNGGKK